MAKPGANSDPTERVVNQLLAQLSWNRPKVQRSGDGVRAEGLWRAPAIRPRRAVIATLSGESARGEVRGLWGRVVLVAALGFSMTQWPYPHECGWALSGFLGAVATLVVGAAWIAFASWRLRSGPAHLLAFVLISWGLLLAAAQVFPRVGYAADRASWSCAQPLTTSR